MTTPEKNATATDEPRAATTAAAQQISSHIDGLAASGTKPIYLLAALQVVLRDMEGSAEFHLAPDESDALLVAAATCAGEVPTGSAPHDVTRWFREYTGDAPGALVDRTTALVGQLGRSLAARGVPRAEHLGLLAAATALEADALGIGPDTLAAMIVEADTRAPSGK